MKSFILALCVLVLAFAQTSVFAAKELREFRDEADQYYAEGNYKKAYKGYLKVAKVGDHYAQHWVSRMNADGEGRKVDLETAYAWSALAAEGGNEDLIEYSEELLGSSEDQADATKKAAKLNKKYGKQALEDKAAALAKRDIGRRSGSCTGSRLTCSRTSGYDAPDKGGQAVGHLIDPGSG